MHTGAPSLGATGDVIRLLRIFVDMKSRRRASRLLTQLKCALVCRIRLNQDSDLSVRIGV